MDTVVLNLDLIVHLTDEQFYQLCMANKDLNLELNAQGELINPQEQQVEIYRKGLPVEVIQMPALISAEEVWPGFQLQV
ncbi:MAG: hypothetical protein V7K14_02380 [Nostoc sp.]|uniref:hypothetical protein n=1 Tax=Nostoc sp. TaxID=1180 RepID=UPI002FFBF458